MLTLQGRITPNRQTIWAVIRKVQDEVESETRSGEEMVEATRKEKRDTLRWAAGMLHQLGYEYEDYIAALGDLAVLAKVEGLAAPRDVDVGNEEGAERLNV